jgi:MSHA biogenesis protein MshL
MSISQMSGTILVRGMPNEHRTIDSMLKSLQLNIERQVIIEAKIIDVELNAESQQGINWSAFNHGMHKFSVGATPNNLYQPTAFETNPASGGIMGQTGWTRTYVNPITGDTTAIQNTLGPSTLANALGTALVGGASGGAIGAGLGIAMQFTNFSALVNFLNTQGQVHVLSSPRISTMNNQKAVIKVGTEEPYVSSITAGSNAVTGGVGSTIATPPNLNYQPFFSGIALDVTPKIDEKGNITIHVHAMVNSITEKYKVSGPEANANRVPFAVNAINETDSVVRSRDGQVIVIGGLMTEGTSDGRDKVPGAGDAPGFGALFRKGVQSATKRELVILLKPTVVVDDSAWTNDIAATSERIDNLRLPPLEQ